jgi:protein-tyrosine-phosphatase
MAASAGPPRREHPLRTRINPAAVEAPAEIGLDTTQESPKKTTDAVETADVVITTGCSDTRPLFPGKRYVDWQLDDPTGRTLNQVRAIRDQSDTGVRALPLDVTTHTGPTASETTGRKPAPSPNSRQAVAPRAHARS